MADEQDETEKSEDPTAKRLEEAIKRGDVVVSQEVATWFMLATATLILLSFSSGMARNLSAALQGIIAQSWRIPMDGYALIGFFRTLGLDLLAIMALPFLFLMLAGIAGHLVQHPLVWSSEPLTPKFSKISPMSGIKRLFGKTAWVNFAKGLVKLTLVGVVMFVVLWPRRTQLEAMIMLEPLSLLGITRELALLVMGTVVAVLLVIAGADYFYQYMSWYQRQRMSMRELKEEFRQSEGDPQVKAKIRQIRQQRARKRMMAAVPDASVVITNPTHYAIALKYEAGMNAPRCVAKGVDALALKIREVAEAHAVPVIENPPLARALHASVDLDEEIPEDHYKAVAEIIGYVMKLRRAV